MSLPLSSQRCPLGQLVIASALTLSAGCLKAGLTTSVSPELVVTERTVVLAEPEGERVARLRRGETVSLEGLDGGYARVSGRHAGWIERAATVPAYRADGSAIDHGYEPFYAPERYLYTDIAGQHSGRMPEIFVETRLANLSSYEVGDVLLRLAGPVRGQQHSVDIEVPGGLPPYSFGMLSSDPAAPGSATVLFGDEAENAEGISVGPLGEFLDDPVAEVLGARLVAPWADARSVQLSPLVPIPPLPSEDEVFAADASAVVARMGEVTITEDQLGALSDLRDVHQGALRSRQLGQPLYSERAVRDRLLADEARAAGLEAQPWVMSGLDAATREALYRVARARIYREAAADQDAVRERWAVDEHYAQPCVRVHAVAALDQEQAETIRAAMLEDPAVSELPGRRTMSPESCRTVVGPDLRERVPGLEPGEIEVFETRSWWMVVHLVERAEHVPFEQVADDVAASLGKEALAAIPSPWVDGTVHFPLAPGFGPDSPVMAKHGMAATVSDVEAAFAGRPPVMLERSMAENCSLGERPCARWWWSRGLGLVAYAPAAAAAIGDGLLEDPSAQRAIALARTEALAGAMLDHVADRSGADPQARRRFYDEHPERFEGPWVQAVVIQVYDRELADSLHARVLAGADPAEVAAEHSAFPGDQRRGRTILDAGWSDAAVGAVASVEVGGVSAVVERQGGWCFVVVEDRWQYKPWEKVADDDEYWYRALGLPAAKAHAAEVMATVKAELEVVE